MPNRIAYRIIAVTWTASAVLWTVGAVVDPSAFHVSLATAWWVMIGIYSIALRRTEQRRLEKHGRGPRKDRGPRSRRAP